MSKLSGQSNHFSRLSRQWTRIHVSARAASAPITVEIPLGMCRTFYFEPTERYENDLDMIKVTPVPFS